MVRPPKDLPLRLAFRTQGKAGVYVLRLDDSLSCKGSHILLRHIHRKEFPQGEGVERQVGESDREMCIGPELCVAMAIYSLEPPNHPSACANYDRLIMNKVVSAMLECSG